LDLPDPAVNPIFGIFLAALISLSWISEHTGSPYPDGQFQLIQHMTTSGTGLGTGGEPIYPDQVFTLPVAFILQLTDKFPPSRIGY